MLKRKSFLTTHRRAIVWCAALMILVVGLSGCAALIRIAISGYHRTQLQGRADQTALMLAGDLVGHRHGKLARTSEVSGPIAFGRWDATRRRFQHCSMGINAVRVVMEGRASEGWWNLLLAGDGVGAKTHAVAAIRPRDIVFVVDLSNAMTGETRTALGQLLSSATTADEAAAVEDRRLRELYVDLGFETYPGVLEPFGAPWQVGEGRAAYETLISGSGPLADRSTDERYRIVPGDSVSTRRRKAYLAVIDRQIMRVMPQARPKPDRPENHEYWAGYLDEVLASHGQDSRIGYATYLRYMLWQGRSIQVGGLHVPLSQFSDECPWRSQVVDGRQYRFSPRIQPMHDVQRGLLGALRDIAVRNYALEPGLNRDRVAIVTFDSLSPEGAWLEQPPTSDYRAVAKKVTQLQAVGERVQSTAGLAALQLAERLLQRSRRGALTIRDPSRLVVFVTTGTTHEGEAIETQIARMARRGQVVKVIPIGEATDAVTAELPDAVDDSVLSSDVGGLQDGHGRPRRCLKESSIRDTVASAPVALVE